MATTEPSPSKAAAMWRDLIVENPMLIEVSRFKRRFLEAGRGKSVNTTIVIVAIVAYAGLLLVIANMSGDFPPVALIMLQTGVFCLLAPAVTFGSVAGERERRSWDLLLVAPISHAQIIIGKFMAAVAAVAGLFVLFLLPTIFTALTFRGDFGASTTNGGMISGSYAFISEEVISISFALMLSAMALLFSARCKRSLVALGIVLVAVFVGLIVFPIVMLGLTAGTAMADGLNMIHPFLAISRLEEMRQSTAQQYNFGYNTHVFGPVWYGLGQIVIYGTFTAVFLVWAVKTVTFADGDKRFIPRKPNA